MAHYNRISLNVGDRYGRLTIIGPAVKGRNCYKHECRCDCGKTKLVNRAKLANGHTSSCGCLWRERFIDPHLKHGHSAGGKPSPEHKAWAEMKQRCQNPNNREYHRYGARGISVCTEWAESFQAFIDHMGNRPSPKHSLDRIDNNGDYEPGNCRWATRVTQARNCRSNRFVTCNGERRTIAEWAEITGIRASTIGVRLNNLGWSEHDSVTVPTGSRRRKSHQ